jgi:LacI family transcriptional regulator
MDMARPTLRTIAKLTGFSVTTVSRALKDGPELSRETKHRVQEVADRIGYHPNRAGVRLRTGRTFVVCLILDQADDMNDFARSLLLGMTAALVGTRYHLLVLPQNVGQNPIDPVRYVLDSGAADGLMMAHTEPQDERVKLLLERDFPFVTLGRTELSTPHPYYDVDNADFTYRATRHLIDRGRRRIILLRPPARYTYSGHQLAGYRRALYEAGLQPIPAEDVHLYSPPRIIRQFARERALGLEPPDGYVCGSEAKALAILSGLRDAGAKVASDVDVLPKETTGLFDYIYPPMSGLFEDFTHAGNLLIQLLLRRIEGDRPIADLQVLNSVVLKMRETEASA